MREAETAFFLFLSGLLLLFLPRCDVLTTVMGNRFDGFSLRRINHLQRTFGHSKFATLRLGPQKSLFDRSQAFNFATGFSRSLCFAHERFCLFSEVTRSRRVNPKGDKKAEGRKKEKEVNRFKPSSKVANKVFLFFHRGLFSFLANRSLRSAARRR